MKYYYTLDVYEIQLNIASMPYAWSSATQLKFENYFTSRLTRHFITCPDWDYS